MKCVNENCSNDPMESPNWIAWGCDFDACCDQACYDAARRQMDHLFGTIAKDDTKFAKYLGVPVEMITKSEKK